MSVAVFNIARSKDASGADIKPLHEYVPGFIRYIQYLAAVFHDTVLIDFIIPKAFPMFGHPLAPKSCNPHSLHPR